MKLSLEACEVLDAIDKKGSFAAAAAALYRVPSTVTYTSSKVRRRLRHYGLSTRRPEIDLNTCG